jgi:branched-chain amino acid transport system ATP-binding protein
VTTPPLLEAVRITKRFAGISALEDVSVDVRAGELVGLIGPNGAGKTTLFDCLSGKLRPDGGDVAFEGRSLVGLPVHRRARLGLARTFQRIELFSGMNVRDHLLVAERARHGGGGFLRDAVGRSHPTADELERCDRMLDLLGLSPDADRPIESLSLGRGRLVELGRALMTEPKLLFLDEPSSGLDRRETHDMGTVLRAVQERSDTAILLVEHDVPMVQRLATRLYVLDAGHLIASGPTREVLDDPAVRAAYLGVGV